MSKHQCRKNAQCPTANASSRSFRLHPWVSVILSTFVIGHSTLFALLAIGATTLVQSTILEKQGPAALSVRAKVERGQVEIRLADSLLLTLTVDGSNQLEVKPCAIQASEAIKVRGRSAPVITVNGNTIRWQQTFHLEPLVPGDHAIKLDPLEHREKPGEWQTITWRAVLVKVTTQFKLADDEDIRDITHIEELPERPSPWIWVYWSLAGIAGVVLLLFGVRQWRKRRRKTLPSLTPRQWALRELERVLAFKLPARGEVERFHTLLSNVVRRYLEKRFALPARQQTTPEFLQTMQNSPQLSAEQQALVRSFLERCDLAKFANAQVSVDECAAAADMVAKLLQESPT